MSNEKTEKLSFAPPTCNLNIILKIMSDQTPKSFTEKASHSKLSFDLWNNILDNYVMDKLARQVAIAYCTQFYLR